MAACGSGCGAEDEADVDGVPAADAAASVRVCLGGSAPAMCDMRLAKVGLYTSWSFFSTLAHGFGGGCGGQSQRCNSASYRLSSTVLRGGPRRLL